MSRKSNSRVADRPRVLVLEPDKTWRDLIAMHLSAAAFEVFAAGSLAEAQDAASASRPHAALIEILLADAMPFRALAGMIRSSADNPSLPLIVFSREIGPKAAERCLNASFNDYLIKSEISFPSLIAAIGRHISL